MIVVDHLARLYARSIIDLASSQGTLPHWRDFLFCMSQLTSKLEDAFQDPRLTNTLRYQVLEASLPEVTEEQLFFLKILIERKRLSSLPAINAAFRILSLKNSGVCWVKVQTAYSLSEEEKKSLLLRLAQYADSVPDLQMPEIYLEEEIHSDLLGGVRCIIGDTLIDFSVLGRLVSCVSVLQTSSV